jgi:hypothetical protein
LFIANLGNISFSFFTSFFAWVQPSNFGFAVTISAAMWRTTLLISSFVGAKAFKALALALAFAALTILHGALLYTIIYLIFLHEA